LGCGPSRFLEATGSATSLRHPTVASIRTRPEKCQPKFSQIRAARFRFRPFLVCWNITPSGIPTRWPFLLRRRTADLPCSGGAPLTYGLLNQHLDQVGRTLRAMRIGRRDRVAVVLPNGPEMAVAFLAILIFNRPRRHFRS